MGSDKGSLPFGDTTILQRIVSQLVHYFDDLIVVTGPSTESSPSLPVTKPSLAVTVIHDEMPHQGPVSALARGFVQARHPIVFACSCDLPLLNGAVAHALCAMLDGFDAVIPDVGARLQPLHAAYRRAAAGAALRGMEAEGERRLRALALRLHIRRVGEAELRPRDPELLSLLNVNTPADYARALRYVQAGRG
jgi:molybdopterin-guanine dinucleotide biosynthesis protein A